MDQNQERRRGHFHRGRRGPDRRGSDRRGPQPQRPAPAGRDEVDVEEIMREIRARISQRRGVELSNQQIQELAARRLESILDPRTIKPALLDEMRRSARPVEQAATAAPEPPYSFEDTTLYDSHRSVLRFVRRLLNPFLKLFFNPNPLIRVLNSQARLNVEAAQRESERERRQSEWHALHYEIVQRLVTEMARVSFELQSLSARIESLSAKVDFNERRVRGIEGRVALRPDEPVLAGRTAERTAMHQARRPSEGAPPVGVPASETPPGEPAVEGQPAEPGRRRRRRRRGRRGGGAVGEMAPSAAMAPSIAAERGSTSGPDAESAAPKEAGIDDVIAPPVTTEGEMLVPRQEPRETALPETVASPPWDQPSPPAPADEAPAAPPERPEPAILPPGSGTPEQ